MTKTEKLFTTAGGTQGVRLPAEFRFAGDQVFVRRDERTGDVILTGAPRSSWSDFMAFRAQLGAVAELDDFLADRNQQVPA